MALCQKCGGPGLIGIPLPAKCEKCGDTSTREVCTCGAATALSAAKPGRRWKCPTCGVVNTVPKLISARRRILKDIFTDKETRPAVVFLIILVLVGALWAYSSIKGTDWKLQMQTACADVENIQIDSTNGTLAASDLPSRVQAFYHDAAIGNPALQAGALTMQQAVTSIANAGSGLDDSLATSLGAKYQAGLQASLSACATVGD